MFLWRPPDPSFVDTSFADIPSPSCPLEVSPCDPIEAIKAAAGEVYASASSPNAGAASGVEDGCDAVLTLCECPCKDAGVLIAGDLCEKGRPIGRGDGVGAVAMVFLGVETVGAFEAVAILRQ